MNTEDTVKVYSPTLEETELEIPGLILNFAKEIKCPILPKVRDIRESIRNLWPLYITIFARRGSCVIGGMQSLVCPHVWNRGVMSSQELFFWVEDKFRGGSAAARILKLHEKKLENYNVRLRSLSILKESSHGVSRAYNRIGYQESERIFTKWIDQQ